MHAGMPGWLPGVRRVGGKAMRFSLVVPMSPARALPRPWIMMRRRPRCGKWLIATTINGLPGFVLRTDDGVETIALEISDDAIVAIYTVRNPDKLHHLTQ